MPPAQTIANGESRLFSARRDGAIRVALAFPNTYYVGMSNLGFQLVYRLFNLLDDVTCERFFLPDRNTIQRLRSQNKPLTSIESGKPLGSFHLVAFSLSFENDYLNLLTMLSLGRIEPLRARRRDADPLLLAGGIASSLNPEPLAHIFDLFLIGEAEEAIDAIIAALRPWRTGKARGKPPLENFAVISGMYIPTGYSIAHRRGGLQSITPKPGFPAVIRSRRVSDLNAHHGCSCLATPHTEFANMRLVEISRGCPRRCKFCAAGHLYSPYRTRSPDQVLSQCLPASAGSARIGILGSAVSDHPRLTDILGSFAARGVRASVSSLRADALSDDTVRLLQSCGHKSFTIAPEAGSEELRRAIGKNMSTEAILEATALLARHGVTHIRLYFMVGLPTETPEDIDAIITLTRQIKHRYYREAGGQRQLNHLALSISPFVPKPFTPFQWHPFEQVSHLKRKLKKIGHGLQKERKVSVQYDLPKWGYVQTLLSRGDRRVGQLLLSAFEQGGSWQQTFRQSDINPDFYAYRQHDYSETLPWDHIDHGLNKQQLWDSYQQTLARSKS